jgi:hypothetical protein
MFVTFDQVQPSYCTAAFRGRTSIKTKQIQIEDRHRAFRNPHANVLENSYLEKRHIGYTAEF